MEKVTKTVRAVIPSRDKGLKILMDEYKVYKRVLISRVQKVVRQVIKDRNIKVYAQQKWLIDQKLSRYIRNLPLHPMPFHNQSVWIHEENGKFQIHFKTGRGQEAVCGLIVPKKYCDLVKKASGKDNPVLGQVELIEDKRYGWVNCHMAMRLPKPKPYKPRGWIGVDVGWNKLAASILITARGSDLHFSQPTVHGKEFKTRIIRLRYLLKQYARKGKAWKKWHHRLQHIIKYAVGTVAKQIVYKAKKFNAGVAMEELTFKPVTKGYIIPRYKLKIAVKTLCEREGVPFKLVSARDTSITCPKCKHKDRRNRKRERFTCRKCGYQADADIVAAMNIAERAWIAAHVKGRLLRDWLPQLKLRRLHAFKARDVATRLRAMTDDLYKGSCKPTIIEERWCTKPR